MKPSGFLTPEQIAAVERAIGEAERQTSAEIVVAIAPQSGRYDRSEDIFGVLLGVSAVVMAWIMWQDLRTDDWSTTLRPEIGLATVVAVFLFWAVVGAALATVFPVLARPFIPRGQIEAEVRRRGFEAFHVFRVGHTTGRTGVLVFISLFERMALVTGDEAINARLPAGTWETACRAITGGFRSGRYADGLVEAVSLCGQALEAEFPRRESDAGGELPNAVRFME